MAEGADRIHEIFVWGFGRFRVCCICWGHSAKPAFLTRFTTRLGTDDSGPFVFLGGGPLSGAVRSCFRGALEGQRGFRGLKFGPSETHRAWGLARGRSRRSGVLLKETPLVNAIAARPRTVNLGSHARHKFLSLALRTAMTIRSCTN